MTRETENNLMAEIAENERWLAQYEAPAPRDRLVDEIKASMRTELNIADDVARTPSWWQRPWHGAVAAAAMVAICVGVVRYAQTLDLNAGGGSLDNGNVLLADAGNSDQTPLSDWKALPSATDFDDEPLDELEDFDFGDSWALSGASMYETFEAAFVDDAESAGEPVQQGALPPAEDGQTRSV